LPVRKAVFRLPFVPVQQRERVKSNNFKKQSSCEPGGKYRHASCSQREGNYKISGPFRSAAGFAPTCSTRRDQFEPR